MRFALVAALLSVSQAVRIRDDFLVEASSVADYMDQQADMNVLGTVRNNMMEEIPDNMQVTYPQAMKYMNHDNVQA